MSLQTNLAAKERKEMEKGISSYIERQNPAGMLTAGGFGEGYYLFVLVGRGAEVAAAISGTCTGIFAAGELVPLTQVAFAVYRVLSV